ncbi:hypothetical protein MYCTH_2312120 [Thermothelomyces thermophilus ATCC 42464]|uniref:Chromosome transmission fidelity protein 4 n=1 Tax=Thermothelomyces thermophilus (strain ATCC 42464 / BCRC 31852 / DSM 1799) TaxID=573729 RepID=G2QQ37_THET4|nr:uncharacterized protein MYCTH_2312120 [Thermothelomyces thermophilus ATCC 42464]AEO61700.1 hypothetical protein MYCTH_2312120 [Thermothelomyces thermophilus ATCC 42464]
MCAPARVVCRPLRGSAARLSSAAAGGAPSFPQPWGSSPGIERLCCPAAPAVHISTTAQPPRTSSLPAKSLSTFREPVADPTTPPELTLFTSHPPLLSPESGNNKPPDERKVKLGKTLRILQAHLPTLLQSPPPQQILSPSITLHLFPSTHPHLPTVSGRVAYTAALWSSPIAWNRVPLVGNVRLEILSERMVDTPVYYPSGGRGGRRPEGAMPEQLIVRWRTVGGGGGKLRKWWLGFGSGSESGSKGAKEAGKTASGDEMAGGKGKHEAIDGARHGGSTAAEHSETEVKAPVGMAQPVGSSKEFTGLFIFDFDNEGRILSHTIEHVQEGGQWEKGVGAKVVGLTDWLLGGIKGGDTPCPAFARTRFRKGGP